MKTRTLVTTAFALASFPLLAQQPPPASQMPPNTQAASPEVSALELSPVNGELVSRLDSKTAKAGDSVVVKTKSSVKTADGTEIPKGSKVVGRVVGVHPSEAGETSQVSLQFDHIELNGGQSVPVHSQIQSIAPAGGNGSTSGSAMGAPPTAVPPNPNGNSRASGVQQTSQGNPGTTQAASDAPAAGTIVAKSGNIAIRTTSVPGVLLANNAPGQEDPRMAQVSSILLGNKQDIQLDSGTQMVIGVAAAGRGQ